MQTCRNSFKSKKNKKSASIEADCAIFDVKFYASILAYVAFASINSLRGATSSPINMENT